jgi:hypothetical protein
VSLPFSSSQREEPAFKISAKKPLKEETSLNQTNQTEKSVYNLQSPSKDLRQKVHQDKQVNKLS